MGSENLIDDSMDGVIAPPEARAIADPALASFAKSEDKKKDPTFFETMENKSKMLGQNTSQVGRDFNTSLWRINLKQTQQDNKYLRSEIDEFRSTILEMEGQIRELQAAIEKKDQEVHFLRGKYKDNIKLECLQGEILQKTHRKLDEAKREVAQRDKILVDLHYENNLLKKEIGFLTDSVEAEIHQLHLQIDKERMVKEAAKKKLDQAMAALGEKEEEAREAVAKCLTGERQLEEVRRELLEARIKGEEILEALQAKEREKVVFANENLRLQGLLAMHSKGFSDRRLTNHTKNDEIIEQIEAKLAEESNKVRILEAEKRSLAEQLQKSERKDAGKVITSNVAESASVKVSITSNKACQTADRIKINTFSLGVECSLAVEEEKSTLKDKILPLVKKWEAENPVLGIKKGLEKAQIETLRDLTDFLMGALKSLGVRLAAETLERDRLSQQKKTVDGENNDLKLRIEDFSNVILNLKSAYEAKDKNLKEKIEQQQLEIEKLRGRLEKVGSDSQRPRGTSPSSSNLMGSNKKQLRRRTSNSQIFKNEEENESLVLAKSPKKCRKGSKSDLESFLNGTPSQGPASKTTGRTRFYEPTAENNPPSRFAETTGMVRRGPSKPSQFLTLERQPSVTVLTQEEERATCADFKSPAKKPCMVEMLSQCRSNKGTEKAFHSKSPGLTEREPKSGSKPSELPAPKKFFFETLSPAETVETFRRFLTKISNSPGLIAEVKKSPEMLLILNSLYG